jgi:hypothetical protein
LASVAIRASVLFKLPAALKAHVPSELKLCPASAGALVALPAFVANSVFANQEPFT